MSEKIAAEETSDATASLLQGGEDAGRRARRSQVFISERLKIMVIVLSLSVNALLLISGWASSVLSFPAHSTTHSHDKSGYAALPRNITSTWEHTSFYPMSDDGRHGKPEGEQLEDWPPEEFIDAGTIALSSDYARKMGLPPGHSFPWDPTKEVFVVNAFHNLHCLRTLRQVMTAVQRGTLDEIETDETKYLSKIKHALHCISTLQQDVICDADDTPRFAGFAEGKSGVGQKRQCRDIFALRKWAEANTACFKYAKGVKHAEPLGVDAASLSESDRIQNAGLWHYSWCPHDSPYYNKAKEAREASFGADV